MQTLKNYFLERYNQEFFREGITVLNENVLMIIGQILGFVAVLLGFLSYQVKTDKRLLVLQIATTLVFSIHYFLIGATSAMLLNAIGIFRNIVYYNKDKKFYSKKLFPIIFAVIMMIVGGCSWEGVHSIFVIVGLVINTYCLSFDDAQNIRKSILVTSPMVLIYDIFELSIGGIIYETVVIISSIIGIFRYRQQKNQ